MKKLFLILALCTSLAHAETWFEATNAGGGKIVLLLQKCTGQEGFIVIAQLPNGTHSTGCWTYVADLVIVLWDGGNIKSSTFNANAFVMKER
jgi:hypothetical protein